MYSMNMGNDGYYDWEKEVEEFEKTKAGVKGLVDSGVVKIPRFFIDQSEKSSNSSNVAQLQIPVIDFQEVTTRRMEIVDEIRKASETWGFFQMVNHGVPMSVMDAILEGTRKFHEQPKESKMEYYSSDVMQKVKFYTILGTLQKSHAASWRDAFSCTFTDDMLDTAAIPPVCRNEITEYMKFTMKLRDTLSDLLSEALGLSQDFLGKMQFLKSESLSCLYYPPCPEPEKTFGTEKHADPTILTVLVQDDTGGLQIHHENYWVDVPPIKGALIANIGSFMQLISNDKFKSVEHRVLARSIGTRVSSACFFYPSSDQILKPYGPLKELENPPIYREVSYLEFVTCHQKKLSEGTSTLVHYKI